MLWLEADDLVMIAGRVLGEVLIRDAGILAAAAARPRATIGGEDAYPTMPLRAAALLEAIVSGHALVDGNKRLGLAATIAFLGMNGIRLDLSEGEAYDLVMDVARGFRDVPQIARRLL